MATTKPAPLNTALGQAIDAAFAGLPAFQDFAKGRTAGPELRSYLSQTAWAQCQILFYRSKAWTAEGGTLYGECYYLVNELQMLLAGQPQSLADPNHEVPSHHYQFGTYTGMDAQGGVEREWQIHTSEDVVRFEARLRAWLPGVILPWTAQFKSIEAIVERMRRRRERFPLTDLLARLGRRQEADAAMIELLSHDTARFTRMQLVRLLDAGLLRAEDVEILEPAGGLRGDRRLAIVRPWMAGRNPAGS